MTKSKGRRGQMSDVWLRASDHILEWTMTMITIPYYLLYARNTKSPITAAAQAVNDQEMAHILQKWINTKHKEAQYVQVAGAVTFASAISTLSWTDLSGRHWTGPACWYASIVLALTAVLAGAQQTMLLESVQHLSTKGLKDHLSGTSNRPNWRYVFAWQSPLMFLSYTIVFYVAGLTSYIASPVAQNLSWNGDAKTLLFYAVTASLALITFAISSRLVHQTLPDQVGDYRPSDNHLEPGDLRLGSRVEQLTSSVELRNEVS